MPINKNILSIDSDDDNENYLQFDEFLNDDTNRRKKKIANEFDEMGKIYLKEIEANKNRQTIEKVKLIPYILKYSENKYTDEDLMTYSIEDVRDIYNQIKQERSSFLSKLFRFIFNI
jgi:hypothetical protein